MRLCGVRITPRLPSKPGIRPSQRVIRLDRLLAEVEDRAKYEAVEILDGLAAISRASVDDFCTIDGKLQLIDGADPKLGLAVQSVRERVNPETGEIECEPRLRDSIKARALYMKHLGMLRDIIQVTTPIPVQFYMPDNGRDSPSR
jgi:hypothetical protein